MKEFKKCTRCQNELPNTEKYFYINHSTNTCKNCLKECAKNYYQKNTEKRKKQVKQYREENRNKVKEIQKKWYENDKERIKEKSKKYYYKNRDEKLKYAKQYRLRNDDKIKEYRYKNKAKISEYNKTYNLENAEKVKQASKRWKQENPEKCVIIKQRRLARKKQLPHTLTIEQWSACKEYFNNLCCYCGEEKQLTQDHFIPLSKGGEYTCNNIVPACQWCNTSKKNKDFFNWYPRQEFYSVEKENKILNYLNFMEDENNERGYA